MADVRPLNDYVLGPFLIADMSADADSQKIPIPMKGQIVGIYTIAVAAQTTLANTLQLFKNGVAMTSVLQTFAPAGGAGDVQTTLINPNLVTGDVDEGDEIHVDNNGAATGGGVGTVMLRIRK